jgi:hypothetical protein
MHIVQTRPVPALTAGRGNLRNQARPQPARNLDTGDILLLEDHARGSLHKGLANWIKRGGDPTTENRRIPDRALWRMFHCRKQRTRPSSAL